MDQHGPSTSPNNPSEEPVAPEQNRAESTPAGQQEPAASGPRLDPAGVDRQQALHTQTVYSDENQQLTPEVPTHPGAPAPGPTQGEMPSAPDAPRLWDFPLLRLPIPELAVGAIALLVLIVSLISLSGSENPGAPLLFFTIILVTLFIGFQVVVLMLTTIPLLMRPVDEFWGDLIAFAPGVLGILLITMDRNGFFLLIAVPIAGSLIIRRFIAYIRWKNGDGPVGFPPPQRQSR